MIVVVGLWLCHQWTDLGGYEAVAAQLVGGGAGVARARPERADLQTCFCAKKVPDIKY
jgi:hypothetical protein